MPSIKSFQQSFGGGELSPDMFGRILDVKYQAGLETCRNFIALPHGPAKNRSGTAFVREVKDSSLQTILIPFVYNNEQVFAIEMGQGYFRFHTEGQTLINPDGTPYEVVNPYMAADLNEIHYVQAADILTLVHVNYPPAELRRYGALDWRYEPIKFESSLPAPTNVTGTPTTGANPNNIQDYKYVVTAISPSGLDESPTSVELVLKNNLLQVGAFNDLKWDAVPGAQRYYIYKLSNNALYGYIGQSELLTFRDDNITPDMSKTLFILQNPFSGPGEYPGAVTYYEQRRCFGGSLNKPQNLWLTRSGTETNLNYSIPTRDDDAINVRVAAREASIVEHLVPLTSMIALTSGAEWRVTSVNSDAITPTSISVKPQSYVGANNVQPLLVNTTLMYCASRGGHIREMAYTWQNNGFQSSDISLRAPHLFDGLDIVDMDRSKAPYPICWFVSSNGTLLGLTYIPEQQVASWHRHDTDGLFESVCVLPEGAEDAVYVIVNRTIQGKTRRYVERMAPRLIDDPADGLFVDSGLTYTGTPVKAVYGLDHLEGKLVNILSDGAVLKPRVVANGKIALEAAGSKIQVGLPIVADLQTLPWVAQVDNAFGQGRTKNVNKAWLRLDRSGSVFVGPDFNRLTESKHRTNEPYGAPPRMVTDEVPLVLTPQWTHDGQIAIRHTNPLPLTVVSLTLEVALG